MLFYLQTGESIPANDAMPIAAPFTIGLFLSHDSVWSRDDINLKYNLSHSIAGDLRRGIVVGETIVLQEFVQGQKYIIYFPKRYLTNFN